jgi:hypothetical protein
LPFLSFPEGIYAEHQANVPYIYGSCTQNSMICISVFDKLLGFLELKNIRKNDCTPLQLSSHNLFLECVTRI